MRKSLYALAVFFTINVITPAQEADTAAALRSAIETENYAELGALLDGADGAERAALEAAALEAAERAVLAGKLEQAASIAETVLLSNLDNAEAQSLYAGIEDAKRSKAALEERKKREAEEARAKAEAEAAAKAEAEAASAREAAEKEAAAAKAAAEAEAAENARREEAARLAAERERKEREEAEKEAYIRSVREVTKKNFSARAELSPLSALLSASPFADEYKGTSGINASYGYRAAAAAYFSHPFVAAYAEADWEQHPLALSGADVRRALSARVGAGYPAIGLPLFIYAGYRSYARDGAENAALLTEFGGPALGLSLERLAIGSRFETSFRLGWNAASAVAETADAAFEGGAAVRYYLKEASPAPYLGFSIAADALSAGGEWEWALSASLSFGVAIHG